MDAVGGDPAAFAEAMAPAMEAFSDAMGSGGTIEDAMGAMGDAVDMGAMADMGITPEMFEGAGDAFMTVAGPALQTMGPDTPPADVGAAIEGCVQCCMGGESAPPMPPEITDMCANMGDAVVDAGVAPADMGSAMDCPPMPEGFVPGDPASMPPDAPFCDSPADVAMGPPIDPAVGAEGYDPGPAMGPMDTAAVDASGAPVPGGDGVFGDMAGDSMATMPAMEGPYDPGAAPGVDGDVAPGAFFEPGPGDVDAGGAPVPGGADAADAAIAAAMDSTQTDASAPADGPAANDGDGVNVLDEPAVDDADPSAGMG